MAGVYNKFDYYDKIKKRFESKDIEVHEYQEINYGLQFTIAFNGTKSLIRIYESKKKGIRYDLSQIKHEQTINVIEALLRDDEQNSPIMDGSIGVKAETKKEGLNTCDKNAQKEDIGMADHEELELIGIDESGKGDYFGPLVIAGVYADAEGKQKLSEMGVADSKKLSDSRIALLASQIMQQCKFSIVTIGNAKYNALYDKIKNLNKMLAWGHARVIENILKDVDCAYALSDRFGNPALIEKALMDKGKKIHLEQRPRAEQNVVVAAASIIARNEFVRRLKEMSKEYSIDFPKGASSQTIEAGQHFVALYGREKLSYVAKLHFKTTMQIL